MHTDDFSKFCKILDSICEYYQREPLSDMAVKIYFKALADYSLEQISEAVTGHIQDRKFGKYFPKAADLIDQILPAELSPDELIAQARLASTPIGVLARMHIGSWDLNNQNAQYLRQRAAECLQLLPSWQERINQDTLTSHEQAVLRKYEVVPERLKLVNGGE